MNGSWRRQQKNLTPAVVNPLKLCAKRRQPGFPKGARMRIAIDMIETDEDYDKLTMETPVVVWLAMDIVLNKGQYSPVEITRDSKKIVDGRARLFVAKNVFEQKYVEAVYVPEFSEEEIRQYTASKYFVQKALNKWERAELWDAYVNYVQLKKPEYYPFLTPGRPPAYEEKRDEFPLLTNEQVAEAFNISTRTLRRETHIYRNLTPRLREMAIDEDLSQSVAEEYARLPMPYKEKIEQALTSHKDQISLREALKDGLTRTSEVLGYGKQKPKPALKVHVGELVHGTHGQGGKRLPEVEAGVY
jgi:hypothetical protein